MKKLLIIALALLSVSIVRADEGMWLLSKLKPLNIEKMQQMGFKLTAEDIYDVNKPGIKDAIVGLGNAGRPFRHFCSGEIISPNGLMLTNHQQYICSDCEGSCGWNEIKRTGSADVRRKPILPVPLHHLQRRTFGRCPSSEHGKIRWRYR